MARGYYFDYISKPGAFKNNHCHTRHGARLLPLSPCQAAQGKVSEILLFNCQRTERVKFTPS